MAERRDSNSRGRLATARWPASAPLAMPSNWSARGDSNPDLHGLSVPRLPIAPRADVLDRPTGMHLHTQAEHGPVSITGPSIPSVFKDPALSSWWAARDSNPITPIGENGVTARQRTIRSYRPAIRTAERFNDKHLPRPSGAAPCGREAQTKKAFQGIALEGLMLDDCRASRARDPPLRSGIDRPVDSPTLRRSIGGRRPSARGPDKGPALSACRSNWRLASSTQPRRTM
jgi:hypothetical protein